MFVGSTSDPRNIERTLKNVDIDMAIEETGRDDLEITHAYRFADTVEGFNACIRMGSLALMYKDTYTAPNTLPVPAYSIILETHPINLVETPPDEKPSYHYHFPPETMNIKPLDALLGRMVVARYAWESVTGDPCRFQYEEYQNELQKLQIIRPRGSLSFIPTQCQKSD